MFVFETVIVAFSMFSAIPMPGIRWNDQNMKYSLCAFPLIGAVIALLMAGAAFVTRLTGCPPLVRGAVFCLIPFAVTGGIHLDGFADTADAQASHQDREKKLQILKDGVSTDYSEEFATEILSCDEITATADMKMGDAEADAWGCDLTHEYVNINADYRS